MANHTPSRTPIAGGFIIAIGVLAGALIGAFKGQPTIGFLIGFGIGAAVAGAIWLIGRGR
jgi:uncharacterized membrane protein